ncbi:Tumor necrosis factor receptor superfamily member 1A [Liparis tanakae]|uniref:Tumor necrosis factor receptor superfamily member 1A n=1 Tax=Liparis tanakae TaxID=230148 RepID=A0A4Z2GFF8_9TELE|nr:Tumor necrosis factor receptor superfamily member 1A [Liparis tanakae]
MMAGAGHRGRWEKTNPVGTILLLLMCMFIPTLTLSEPSEERTCPHGDYPTEEGICCNRCSPGFKLVEKCNAPGQRSTCTPCPAGQYTDQMNFVHNCLSCRHCKGTAEKNTVCECIENYYQAKGKCKPCNNCTAECKHHCSDPSSLNTIAPKIDEHIINIIAGVVVVTVVSLMLVVLVTHVATKRSTKKKLLKLSTQPSDVSPDSCEQVLVHSEEPSENMSVWAVPQSHASEQESSNLPDCVPLEIRIPDLIYTVLDLVPVPQVKRLVRSLGVKDTEIEQAETDHRSCREANYQMLRLWAERGPRAGGGGRGRMLHWPLLHELLDKLRLMHLGQAAEELETKYGIQ